VWFSSREFYFALPIAEAAESHLSALEYSFFGHDRRTATVGEFLHKETSPIGAALSGLWKMLSDFRCLKDGPWRVLPLSGFTRFDSEDVRKCARRHTVSLSCGLIIFFDRKFGNLPWTMHRVVAEEWDEPEKDLVCAEIRDALDCNLPRVCKDFKSLFPDVDNMKSPSATGVIQVWEAGKRLSTKKSELGHASERRQLVSAAAPGKAFAKHSRADYLRRTRPEKPTHQQPTTCSAPLPGLASGAGFRFVLAVSLIRM
jgi:hypothetical protein